MNRVNSMGTGTRKRRGNIVARMVEELELATVDKLIDAWARGASATDADKAVVAKWLAKAEARARAGEAA